MDSAATPFVENELWSDVTVIARARQTGQRMRRLVLAAGILYTSAALCWLLLPYVDPLLPNKSAGFLGTPFLLYPQNRNSPNDRWIYAISLLMFLGLMLLTQWWFLRPGRGWVGRLTTKGRPLKSSVMAAAAAATLLTVGFTALVLELPDWWEPIIDTDKWAFPLLVWTSMLLLWALWGWIFYHYWRQGDHYTQLGRMIRGLIGGSLLEVFVAVPVHVWATRQRQCYCERGTYTTLVFSGAVLWWAFGPGIVLLYLREQYRQRRLFPVCAKCGYDLRYNVSGICPECGAPCSDDAR